MIDLDAYCVRCDSDQYTELDPHRHESMRWCSLCWNWQMPLPKRILDLLREVRRTHEPTDRCLGFCRGRPDGDCSIRDAEEDAAADSREGQHTAWEMLDG